jgi:hypothetical protein
MIIIFPANAVTRDQLRSLWLKIMTTSTIFMHVSPPEESKIYLALKIVT